MRQQSGLGGSGQDLIAKAFEATTGPIQISQEVGQSGEDEQEGFRFQRMRDPDGRFMRIGRSAWELYLS